jgi:hypothetical protein
MRRGYKVSIISMFWAHLYHKYAFIYVIPPCYEIVCDFWGWDQVREGSIHCSKI